MEHTKPPINKKLLVILAAAVLVVAAIVAVIFLMPETLTLGDICDFAKLNEYTYVTLYQDEDHFVEEVRTYNGTPIWEAIRDIEFQVTDPAKRWETEREILSSEHIISHVFFIDSIYIKVSRSGSVLIEYFPDEGGMQTYCGRKGEALFEALNSFVPTEGSIAIAGVLPDLEWEEIVLYVTSNGTSSGRIYFDTPQEMNAILEGLEPMVFPYGGAEYDYNAYLNISLELHTADWATALPVAGEGESYYLSFNQDGEGRIWMGQWCYSVSGGEQLMILLSDFID